MGFPGGSMVKNPLASTGDTVSILGSVRYPGGGNDSSHQYYCLENSVDKGPWRAIVHGVAKSWTCTYIKKIYDFCEIFASMNIIFSSIKCFQVEFNLI